MTNAFTVAYSELTRVLPWSLRALGYPFPIADRGSHLTATAAAISPKILDEIAGMQHRPASGPLHEIAADGTLAIDAQGVSLLEVGPPAIDYLAAHAGDAPLGVARIAGASEASLIAAILLTGAEYGLSSIALLPSAKACAWYVASRGDDKMRLSAGTGTTTLLAALLDDIRQSPVLAEAAARQDALTIVARATPFQIDADAAETIDPAKAISTAHARGIPVSAQTLKAIYDLEVLTWMPSSERSRAQAGFTQPAGTAA
ncbi:hypothetical protein [Jiella avicenniae]|uniref:Uncharacterized protein n=1 Tax=Jiella avicenniae TaxID=2907202 RepID=A0A9X1P1S3_9HYPH|nr:hypothetical protein [Jiella avicenniae]MCE7029477.1 hypothetical protein [Jiella avicenniae]